MSDANVDDRAFELDFDAWAEPKPFGFSGLFRVRNDDEFLEVAVRSHLPWLDEAVLCIQPSDDRTYEVAYRLADEEPKVVVHEYPYVVGWTGSQKFYDDDPDLPGHAVHMSNWGMSRCRYSWIVKAEADVIALSTFERVIEAVKARPTKRHYYGRVILNVAGLDCDQISATHPRNAGWDECVVPNSPGYAFQLLGRFAAIPVSSPRTCMGWSALHTKRCKARHQRLANVEDWLPWTPDSVRAALTEFNGEQHTYLADDNPLGEPCLYEREWIDYYLERRDHCDRYRRPV